RRLGRHFVGVEREQAYIDAEHARIEAVEPLPDGELQVMTGKRAEPRVAFVSLIDAGLMKPGTLLFDARRRWTATVRADGTLIACNHVAAIHGVVADLQGLDACNGWSYGHYERAVVLTAIDELRRI